MAKSDKGWVIIQRSIWDSSIWKREEPFDCRSAWIDMILMVNHEEKQMMYKNQVRYIQRGQMYVSLRFLSTRWRWNLSRTRRFLDTLCDAGMIYIDGTTTGTLITLLNYDKIQSQRHRK